MPAPTESRNPFYMLLLIAGLVFIATVLAYGVIPVFEQQQLDAGQIPTEWPFRDALRQDGWKWVLAEVALLIILGLLSMGLDRYRRWKADSLLPPATHDTTKADSPPPS